MTDLESNRQLNEFIIDDNEDEGYINQVNEPFISKNQNDQGDAILKDRYSIEYEGELLYIDSRDWRQSTRLKIQILAAFVTFILFGLAEQAVGTLIPVLQKIYKINDIETSFMYLALISGYIIMGLLNGVTHEYVGLKGVLILGTSAMVIGYGTFSTAPPYFILVCFATFSGIGCGVLDSACNTWVGGLIDSNQILGILHGCYGLGSMLSPSLISYLIERKENPWKWNQYYFVLACIAFIDLIVAVICFKYETAKKYKYMTSLKLQKDLQEIEMSELNDNEEPDQSLHNLTTDNYNAKLSEVIRSPLVWLFSTILFIYIGGEVGFGAWLISFLTRIDYLGYGESSHIATTFWFGLMMGRTVLGFVTAKFFLNELYANLTYIGSSVIGYTLFYIFSFTSIVPIIFIIVLFTGFTVGPIFQTTILASIGTLPPKYHTSGVGFICAIGGSGAAGIPFLVGMIAESSSTGLKVYPLLILSLYLVLLVAWIYVVKRFSSNYKKAL